MEEKKSKVVSMNGKADGKQQKLTYEQLNDACNQLFQQNQYLTKQVRELSAYNAFKRLDYLFKVVENSKVFGAEFTKQCMEEIKETITIKEEDTQEK